MEQANEREVGAGLASTFGNGLVPLRFVEREAGKSVRGATERPSWINMVASSSGRRRMSKEEGKPTWVLKHVEVCHGVAEMAEGVSGDVLSPRMAATTAGSDRSLLVQVGMVSLSGRARSRSRRWRWMEPSSAGAGLWASAPRSSGMLCPTTGVDQWPTRTVSKAAFA